MYKSRIHNTKSRSNRDEKKRELVFPDEESQEYGIVQDMLGNGRVRVLCNDKTIRIGRICGSMRKYKTKVIIERGDLVIISLRDFEKDKVDIVHKYGFEEANDLAYNKYLPDYITKVYTKCDFTISSKTENSQYIVFANELDTRTEEDTDNKEGEEIDINDI